MRLKIDMSVLCSSETLNLKDLTFYFYTRSIVESNEFYKNMSDSLRLERIQLLKKYNPNMRCINGKE